MICRPIVCVLCLVVALASSADASDWHVEPVIEQGEPLPNGGALLQIGEIFPLGKQELLLWARHSDDGWALYRWHDGAIGFVLPDDTEFRVKGLPEPVKVKYAWGGAKVPTHWQFSDGALFLQARRGATTSDLLMVDAEGLRKVVGAGDTIEGMQGTVNDVDLLASDSGEALMHVRTKKPEKRSYWAIWNSEGLHLVITEDEPLPALNAPRPVKLRHHAIGQAPRPSLWRSMIYAVLTVEGAAHKRALFRMTADKAETLLVEGSPVPEGSELGGFENAQAVSYLGPVTPINGSRFFVYMTIAGAERSYLSTLFEYRDGTLIRQLDVEFPEVGRLASLGAYRLELVGTDPLRAMVAVLLKEPEKNEEWRGIGLAALLDGQWNALPWLELCCPEDDPHLYGIPARLLNFRYRLAGGGFPGIVISIPPGAMAAPPMEPGFHRIKGSGLAWWRYRSSPPLQWVYVDPAHPADYARVPEFETDDGPVSLGAVIEWLGPDTGVAVHRGGLYLIKRMSGAE